MISPTEAATFLPPTFQIITGLSFAAILLIRLFAAPVLRPLWGKIVAFSVLLVTLGSFLVSVATAKDSLSAVAEFLTLAGVSYFAAVLLVLAGLIMAARDLKETRI